MTNAATKREYTTSAVPTAVGERPRSSTMGPIETGMALTLKAIWICASRMMTMGSQEALGAVSGRDDGIVLLAISDDLFCRSLPLRA